MSNITLVEENPLSLAEVKEKLADIKKRDKELEARALKVEGYVHKFAQEKKTKDLAEKIRKLEVSRLKERNIKKIIDIMPQDIDSLKSLFVGENLTLKQEDLQKIISVIHDN
ncbi:hypothetical protein HY500_00300 [Candidatus Woesearchaeota archaeon]|nr:hypothetical protein [Candidatus Woesearchaeota archaeon]